MASGGGRWVRDAQVKVEGRPDADPDNSSTWWEVTIQVEPPDARFQVGWSPQEYPDVGWYSQVVPTLRGTFRMRVGRENVTFHIHALGGHVTAHQTSARPPGEITANGAPMLWPLNSLRRDPSIEDIII